MRTVRNSWNKIFRRGVRESFPASFAPIPLGTVPVFPEATSLSLTKWTKHGKPPFFLDGGLLEWLC